MMTTDDHGTQTSSCETPLDDKTSAVDDDSVLESAITAEDVAVGGIETTAATRSSDITRMETADVAAAAEKGMSKTFGTVFIR